MRNKIGLTGSGGGGFINQALYALLGGRAGGQVLQGGVAANEDLTLEGTAHATKTTSYVILQPTAGNVGIGTTTPTAVLQIEVDRSNAVLGSELSTNGTFAANIDGWTGTNWAYEAGADGQARHTAGEVAALTQNIAVISGTTYQIAWTITGRTAGTVAISVGAVGLGTSGSIAFAASGVGTLVAGATGNLALAITPTTDFDGAITVISCKAITQTAQMAQAWSDDDSAVYGEVRGSASLYNFGAGTGTLQTNTIGYENTAFGCAALQANTTGFKNTAFGQAALSVNTTGNYNTAIGRASLYKTTIGSRNTGCGYGTLPENISGNSNTAVGYTALHFNTVGVNNVAVGDEALYTNVDGGYNTAIGNNALYSNTSHANSAFGATALYSNTTGQQNVANGQASLNSNTTGNGNVAIGRFALFSQTTADYNVGIGWCAGFHETGSNKLFIDNAPRASEADGRAKALIYGVFDAAVANQELTFNTGKMGFFGTAAVAKPTGVTVDAAGIHAALVTLGLIAA